MEKITRKSINEMIERDVDEAFFVLGAEYKKEGTYTTMHNLGTLLSKFGHELTFCPKDRVMIAEKLLLCAKNEKESPITNKELGDLYFEEESMKWRVRFMKRHLVTKMIMLFVTIYLCVISF